MAAPYQILLPLLSLFFVRVDLTDLIPMTYEVHLVRLLDADTVVVKHRSQSWRVRLSKIDAPEKGQRFIKGGGDSGRRSLSCARKVIGTQETFVLSINGHDLYGRMLGELGSLSFDLVKNGCVSLYQHARFRSKQEKSEFLRELMQAKHEKRGLWARGGFLRPKVWRKKFSRRSARQQFHR